MNTLKAFGPEILNKPIVNDAIAGIISDSSFGVYLVGELLK